MQSLARGVAQHSATQFVRSRLAVCPVNTGGGGALHDRLLFGEFGHPISISRNISPVGLGRRPLLPTPIKRPQNLNAAARSSVDHIRTHRLSAIAERLDPGATGTDGSGAVRLPVLAHRAAPSTSRFLSRHTNAPLLVVHAPGTAQYGRSLARNESGNPIVFRRGRAVFSPMPPGAEQGPASASAVAGRLANGTASTDRAVPRDEPLSRRAHAPEHVASERVAACPLREFSRARGCARCAHARVPRGPSSCRSDGRHWGQNSRQRSRPPVSMYRCAAFSRHPRLPHCRELT